MLTRRPATRRKGTRRRVTHPRGTRRSRATRLSTASLRRRSSNSNPAVPVAWKDVWLLSAAVAFLMHASDGEEGLSCLLKQTTKKRKIQELIFAIAPPLIFPFALRALVNSTTLAFALTLNNIMNLHIEFKFLIFS